MELLNQRICCIRTKIIDRTNVRPFQDFSGSSTCFTVEHDYDYGNPKIKNESLLSQMPAYASSVIKRPCLSKGDKNYCTEPTFGWVIWILSMLQRKKKK